MLYSFIKNKISRFKDAFHLLSINPRLFFKYFKCHLKYLLPKRFLCGKEKNINGVVFGLNFDYPIDRTFLKQICLDCYEVSLVEMMKKILKPGDTFIDVGANIGNLTALGASLVGKDGEVHSFEPTPLYFEKLRELVRKNPSYKIIINNYALGEKTGVSKIDFSKPPHIGGSTLILDTLHEHILRETIEVPIKRLDDYIKKRNLEKISLIKIDAEGFEFPILRGLIGYFESVSHKPAIICEITPAAYQFLGYDMKQLCSYMTKYGYKSYNIFNDSLKIDILNLPKTENVIFKHG